MPTGYTAGILDGSTKSFNEFAKQCTRAFGACMHMRDEPFDSEYKLQEPSNYHQLEIDKYKAQLKFIENSSYEDLKENELVSLIEEKSRNEKRIEEILSHREKLELFLLEANRFTPPTSDHHGIKDFMIQQLETTIEHDGDISYHQERINNIESRLNSLDGEIIKSEKLENIHKNIKYHKERLNEEVDRVNKSNKWMIDFNNALK